MTEHDEREELRARQVVLVRRTAELLRETDRLQGSHDVHALRAHHEHLKLHEEEIRAFDERLSTFHQRYGTLDHKGDGR